MGSSCLRHAVRTCPPPPPPGRTCRPGPGQDQGPPARPARRLSGGLGRRLGCWSRLCLGSQPAWDQQTGSRHSLQRPRRGRKNHRDLQPGADELHAGLPRPGGGGVGGARGRPRVHLEVEGEFVWTVSGPANYTYWDVEFEEPYPDPDHERNCVGMQSEMFNLLWITYWCEDGYDFYDVCQLP